MRAFEPERNLEAAKSWCSRCLNSSPSQNAGVFSTTPENIVGDASALPDASWIVRKEGTSRHHADYATCGLREGLLE